MQRPLTHSPSPRHCVTLLAEASVCCFVLFLHAVALAQDPKVPGANKQPSAIPSWATPDAPQQSEAARLMREIAEHSQAFQNLEEMCEDIGPRLTGSDKLRQAQAWAMSKLKGYGAANVHEEPYEFGKAWTRGIAWARILGANGQELHVAQEAWSPATDGMIKGEVALLEAKSFDELKSALPTLQGRIVLLNDLPKPSEEEEKDKSAFYEAVREALRRAQFQALLEESGKPNDLMTMDGSPVTKWKTTDVPRAFIADEHAHLLKRLIARHGKVEIGLSLGGTFSKDPVKAYNVVAEIQGSEKPQEVVIVGGHQDSWDLGTGATDNGTGTVVAMEVLRAMKALGLKPKRTLRVVLFSGEEQGLLGSEAYVKAHDRELGDIQAVLIDDLGSGRITGWPDMGEESVRPLLAAAMAPANSEGLKTIGPFTMPAWTDHWPFHRKGVPSFGALQESLDYFQTTHHSQVDTLDHVVKEDLVQSAQAMAVTAWGLLNGEPLPHHVPLLEK
jgi:carboxypeptidase Q